MSDNPGEPSVPAWQRVPEAVGAGLRGQARRLHNAILYIGGIIKLLLDVIRRVGLALLGRGTRIRASALTQQMIRVGVRSIPIIVLVQIFIGVILALNLAPTLKDYGQLERVADVVAIAVFRELGPLISASRAVIYASSGDDYAHAAREAALKLRRDINSLR